MAATTTTNEKLYCFEALVMTGRSKTGYDGGRVYDTVVASGKVRAESESESVRRVEDHYGGNAKGGEAPHTARCWGVRHIGECPDNDFVNRKLRRMIRKGEIIGR